ncbi:MAG TPA: polyprenyl synthetase family protein [Spirochaetota bacterium]|nr:polyprenyl synthetase family protein [Spirochaetota bacterium]HPS86080.1 polyprenyl synthetase family protein [Spirochaetota bacterium]
MSDNLKKILEPLADDLLRVDEKIKSHLETGVPIIDDSSMHLFFKGGKKIRASLVLLSAGLKSGITDDVIDLAAAVEIIHAASLIHDDIIDKSFMRRGLISVPSKYGDKVAVLAGDYMYSVAVNIAVKSKNDRILESISGATKEMVKGELYQIEYSNIDKITEEHYFNIIERKTGRLMATSAVIGAIKAGLKPEECDIIYNIGLDMGFAFQIIDDTFDFSDSSSITGKDVGNDFKDGKITLPFIYILKSGSEKEKQNVRNFADNPDNADWEKVRDMIHLSGAFNYSINRAGEFAKKAKKQLEIFPDSGNKEIIHNLINFIVERNY